jgi:hypothetical protein
VFGTPLTFLCFQDGSVVFYCNIDGGWWPIDGGFVSLRSL